MTGEHLAGNTANQTMEEFVLDIYIIFLLEKGNLMNKWVEIMFESIVEYKSW